jgi:hypothetical protein
MFIADEETANSPKIDTPEEVGKVKIEDPAPTSVTTGIAHNRSVALESVRDLIFPAMSCIQFGSAILEEI